ncbi:MAG: rhomboid family intramembrane serine protease [Oscillospiraceae bacterium]|jgi:membrane associated rhomboid family serine protease|nr:rhomboid family intramembrane serine protease [Oscillospiraceae bacterium]
MRRWLSRLELRARSKFYIPNLMYYVVGGMAVVFLLDMIGMRASSTFYLDMGRVAQGQVWRLLTFIFLPPSNSLLWVLFSLYFYWMIGNALETQWGSFRFNLYYLLGILGAIIGALITGSTDNTYLNMSLFLAFAALFPEFQVYVFFILPVKMKWLALFDLVLYGYSFVMGTWATRVAILFSLLNVAIFFGGDLLTSARLEIGTLRRRRNFRNNYRK